MRSKKGILISVIIALVVIIGAVVAVILIKNSKKPDDCQFLIKGDWSHYDSNIGENLNITFTENFEYMYNCDCGEPVGNSDCYDTYSYDAEEKVINLSGPDDFKSEIKVLYYDDNFLCLLFDDGEVTFKNNNAQYSTDEVDIDAVKYVGEDTKAYLFLLDFDGENMTFAPSDYETDTKELFEDYITELKASENITFSSVSVTIDNGKKTVDYKELTEADYPDIGEFYNIGYVDFNEKGEVNSVVFYGTLEIMG